MTMKERGRIDGRRLEERVGRHRRFPRCAGGLQARLRWPPALRSARPAALAPRPRALDRRDDPGAALVRLLVLEQGVEGAALERVDQADDLVGVEVVVLVDGRLAAVLHDRRGA